MSADNVHHHFISNDDIIDDNRDTLINHLPQATEPKTTTTTTATVNRPTGSGHCRHNSLVDFSFIMDQSSTNTCECGTNVSLRLVKVLGSEVSTCLS